MISVPLRHSALAAYVICLVILGGILSAPRITGDGAEYLAVADNISRFERPSLTPEQREKLHLNFPSLTSSDSRQDVMHFWTYTALASPFVAASRGLGIRAEWGFAALNLLLIAAAFASVSRSVPLWAVLVLFLSPVIWWTNKVHSEVFTFSLLCLALVPQRAATGALLILGIAATQNPPILGVAVCLAYCRIRQGSIPVRSALLALAGASAIAATHFLYYQVRLGRPTPLVDDVRIPGFEALGYVVWDPNVGLLFNYPFVAVVVALACIFATDRISRGYALCGAGAALVVLTFAFAQAPNVNHGGTPGMSRYALWLLASTVPILSVAPTQNRGAFTGLSAGLVIASTCWTLTYFRPGVPESYLEPTRVALYQWTRFPGLHNPLPEIFAERLRHQDMAHLVAATPACEKVLLYGGVWPSHCTATPPPKRCLEGLCYANKTGDEYEFVETSRRGGKDLSDLWEHFLRRSGKK